MGSKPNGLGRWAFPSGTEVIGVYRQRVIPFQGETATETAAIKQEGTATTKSIKQEEVFLSWETKEIKATPITNT